MRKTLIVCILCLPAGSAASEIFTPIGELAGGLNRLTSTTWTSATGNCKRSLGFLTTGGRSRDSGLMDHFEKAGSCPYQFRNRRQH